jgi:hypothetical protein
MPLLTGKRSAESRKCQQTGAHREIAFIPEVEGHGEVFLKPSASTLFPRCANPHCARGWLRMWRSRSTPVFEGGWCCSAECARMQLQVALSRELSLAAGSTKEYRHRIPLGLSMLEKGWITAGDLRHALELQRTGGGRIGQWFVRTGAVDEANLSRALASQWSCPVLGLDPHDSESMAMLIPRLFVDALGVLPLRIAAQRILYLAFAQRPSPVLAMAIERMTGLRVESGILGVCAFREAHAKLLNARYPAAELREVSSESEMLRALTNAIEDVAPVESRLVRLHDFLWLRTWTRRPTGTKLRCEDIRDIILALTSANGPV